MPDGSLLVADDKAGRIYRITYRNSEGGLRPPRVTQAFDSLVVPIRGMIAGKVAA
jgi:hypothetical protein